MILPFLCFALAAKFLIATAKSMPGGVNPNIANNDGSNLAIKMVIDVNFPDPSAIKIGNTYWAFGTQGKTSNHVQVARAESLYGPWQVLEKDALPVVGAWSRGADTPTNITAVKGRVWAPHVIPIRGTSTSGIRYNYVLYYASPTFVAPNIHCVGAAYSSTVDGPYTALDDTIDCPKKQGGAIDISGFRDESGTYVTYKVDGNAIGKGGACGNMPASIPTPIMIMRMDDGGLHSVSAPEVIQRNRPEDGAYIEAPNLLRIQPSPEMEANAIGSDLPQNLTSYYILMFSPQCFTTPFYSVHYAYSKQLTGGVYQRNKPDIAILRKNDPLANFYAPGGASAVVGSVQGNTFEAVFHANLMDGPPRATNPRQMWVARLKVTTDTMHLKVSVGTKG